MSASDDPTLRNARREGWVIFAAWAIATTYCSGYYYFFGLIREGRPLGRGDVQPIMGVPSWFFFGVLLPWAACGIFTLVFAGFVMAEDELGADHASELEAEIHEQGLHE